MEDIDKLAKTIWNYLRLNQKIEKANCILVLGSNDKRVADRAIELYFKKYANYIIFSGGIGRLTKNIFKEKEADIFAGIAYKKGVPREKVLIENKSTNTGENIRFTKKLLKQKGLNFKSFIVVQKPYMERRSYATFKKNWSRKKVIVTSPKLSYENYFTKNLPKKLVLNIMVGDLQRIKLYYKKGFQIYQKIPKKVWDAYEKLVTLGFNEHIIKD